MTRWTLLCFPLLLFKGCLAADPPLPIPEYCKNGAPSGLPLPSSLPLADYETKLYGLLFKRACNPLDTPASDC